MGDAVQGDLFDQPIPERPEFLYWPQFWRLFVEHHWHRCVDATKHAAICRYILEMWQGRLLHMIREQDIKNLLWDLSKPPYSQGAWALIKARSIVHSAMECAISWQEDGGVGNVDLTRCQVPRRNPVTKKTRIQEPAPIDSLSPWEWRKWVRYAKQEDDDVLVSALRIGIWGKISPADLLELNDDEIFDDAMEIRLYRRHTKNPKTPGGQLQVIKMTERFWGEIERLRRFRCPGVKWLVNTTNWRRRLAAVRKRAKDDGCFIRFRLQLLRRSGAQRLKDLGWDSKTNADGMGLTTPKVLEKRYAVGLSPKLREATAALVKEYNE